MASLVSSLVPDNVPACAADGEWQGAAVRPALVVWMILAAGVPPDALLGRLPADLVDLATRVRQLAPDAQLRWYRTNLTSTADCVTRPRLDPAEFAGATA